MSRKSLFSSTIAASAIVMCALAMVLLSIGGTVSVNAEMFDASQLNLDFIKSSVNQINWENINNKETIVRMMPKAFEHFLESPIIKDETECVEMGSTVSKQAIKLEQEDTTETYERNLKIFKDTACKEITKECADKYIKAAREQILGENSRAFLKEAREQNKLKGLYQILKDIGTVYNEVCELDGKQEL